MKQDELNLISQKLAHRIDDLLAPLHIGAKLSLIWPEHSRWPMFFLRGADNHVITKSAFDVISMMALAHLYMQARDEVSQSFKDRHYITLSKSGEESSHSILAIKAYLPSIHASLPLSTITHNPQGLALFLNQSV